MQEFLEGLMFDMALAIKQEKMEKFTDFLSFLDEVDLEKYLLISKLYDDQTGSFDSEMMEKATMLYCFVLQFIEDKESESVKMDADGEWMGRLVYLLGMEKMRRMGLIVHLDGCLKDGLVEHGFAKDFEQRSKDIFGPNVFDEAQLNTLYQRDK